MKGLVSTFIILTTVLGASLAHAEIGQENPDLGKVSVGTVTLGNQAPKPKAAPGSAKVDPAASAPAPIVKLKPANEDADAIIKRVGPQEG